MNDHASTSEPAPILELRVHGVNNTPATDMLDLPADSITEDGDSLGGFWSPKPGATVAIARGRRGFIPPHVVREAYSWGAMPRANNVPGGGLGGKIAAIAARIGWILLMPFGLANVAFWTRLQPDDPTAEVAGRRTMRLFALVLTLIATLTLVAVVVDMFAIQCLHDENTCRALPSFLDFARSWPEGRRVAAAMLVVLTALALLTQLCLGSNVRYEVPEVWPPHPGADDADDAASSPLPLLAQSGFWARADDKRRLLWLHMSVAASTVVLVVGIDWNWRDQFRSGGQTMTPLDPVPRVLWLVASLSVAVVLLEAAFHLLTSRADVVRGGDVGGSNDLPPGMRLLALVGVVSALLALVWQTPTNVRSTVAIMSTSGPALLVAVATGFALVGCALTFHQLRRSAQVAMTVSSVAIVLGLMASGWTGYRGGSIGAAAVTLLYLVAYLAGGEPHPAAALRARAAGVLMLVSLGFLLLLCSASVLVVGDWLNTCLSAADLTPVGHSTGCSTKIGDTTYAATDVVVPAVLHVAGSLVLPCFLLLALVAGAWLLLNHRASFSAAPREASLDREPPIMDVARHSARRRAALLGRAEPLIALLALVVLLDVTAAIGLATPAETLVQWAPHDTPGSVPAWLNAVLSTGAVGTTFVVLLLIGLLVGNAAPGAARPFGLLWDLVGFLPRDGHPLSPPCYAERAVPELTGRVRSWLTPSPISGPKHPRVILSGHSLGGVLCVAAILQLRQPHETSRLSLITYGSQLQAYFSRLFPRLLGPQVLGVPGRRTPPFLDVRHWPDTIDIEPLASSVTTRLSTSPTQDARWRNLWRATDPLGFPVARGRRAGEADPDGTAVASGPIDFGAAELDMTGYLPLLCTHSDYPRTPDYQRVLQELINLEPPIS